MSDSTRTFSRKRFRLLHAAIVLILLIGTIGILLPVRANAETPANEVQIPAAIYPGIDYLLALADPAQNIAFDPQLAANVLDFVETPKRSDALYFANTIGGLTSGYYEFDICKSLETVAAYSFNPDIPAIATMPSSARLFQWADPRGNRQESPRLDPYLDKLESPVVLKGMAYLEITPDLTSGAYYGYKSYQVFLLFKHRQHKVLAIITRQADVSSVGKKGYILGEDNDWDYYYSGKPGLTLPALGWVRSYMYDSSGINIYHEIDPDGPRVRCGMFKWLRAGWSKINMVQKKHIYRGLQRFAVPFKEILEHPGLPSAATMAYDLARITGLSDADLISKMDIYAELLEKRHNSGSQRGRKWPRDLFENKDRWRRLSREEMASALVVEYVKYAIGKSRSEAVGELLGLSR